MSLWLLWFKRIGLIKLQAIFCVWTFFFLFIRISYLSGVYLVHFFYARTEKNRKKKKPDKSMIKIATDLRIALLRFFFLLSCSIVASDACTEIVSQRIDYIERSSLNKIIVNFMAKNAIDRC